MKLSIPGKFSEITLAKFLAWYQAKSPVQKVSAITGLRIGEVRKLNAQAVTQIVQTVEEVMELKTATHVKIIRHENADYGFIPDITNLTYGEHADLSNFAKVIWGEKTDYTHLPDMLAVLYRPVTERVKDKYRIAKYDSDRVEHLDAILAMSMDKVQGALLFFSSIRTKLLSASLPFLEAEMKKAMEEVSQSVTDLVTNTDGST